MHTRGGGGRVGAAVAERPEIPEMNPETNPTTEKEQTGDSIAVIAVARDSHSKVFRTVVNLVSTNGGMYVVVVVVCLVDAAICFAAAAVVVQS